MKAIVNHSKFSKAILYTSRCVSSKPNIPVLSNVYIDATEDGIHLYATNLEMSIHMWIPGIIENTGKTTVSAKYLSDFLIASKSDNVNLELVDNVLKVFLDKTKASFNTISYQDYPFVVVDDKQEIFQIKKDEFLSTVKKVLFACSSDSSIGKIQQTGVFIEPYQEDKVAFVGLDGIRLSLRYNKVSSLNSDLFKNGLIIPSKYLQEFSKIVESEDSENSEITFFISASSSQISFKYEDIDYNIRLIDGNYPDYKKILPESYSYRFVANRNDLEEAVKVVGTFAKGNLTFKTLFDFDPDVSQVIMKSSVVDIGENEFILDVSDSEGENKLESAYNLKLLQDIVSHISSERVVFETKGPLAATVIKDSEDENFLHMLMPLRREEF